MKILSNKGYLVLSVNDCKALLAAAQRSQKASRTRDNRHCIILNNLRVLDDGNSEVQISAAMLVLSCREVCEQATKNIALHTRMDAELAAK